MKDNLFVLFLLITAFGYSQDNTVYTTIESKEKAKENSLFYQFDVNIPLKANTERGTTYSNGSTSSNSWFVPDGLGTKFGVGLHKKNWIAISFHTGLEWKGYEKLVAVPIYGNLKWSPKIGVENRLVLQAGLGKGFALGRGRVSGDYMKFGLGIENDEDMTLSVEVSNYDISYSNVRTIGIISLGISMRYF